MSRCTWEAEIERCYGAFDQRHAELRRQLEAALAARLASDEGSSRGTSGADVEPPRSGRPMRRLSPRRSRWGWGTALAASLLTVVLAWSLLPLGTSAPAFGMDDLPGRLQGVRSIYVRGLTFHPPLDEHDAQRPATRDELYVERPNRLYRLRSHGTRTTPLRQTRRAFDGSQRIELDDLDATATLGKDQPLAAEYMVEVVLQNSISQQLLGGPTASGFRKIRSEQLLGVNADVYERVFQYPDRLNRVRYVVWLDPATGFPLRVEHFSKFGDQAELLLHVAEEIEINGPPPAGAFDFTPPVGYTCDHQEVSSDQIGSDTSGSVRVVESGKQAFHALRFCFNISDRAALVCWARYNDLAPRRETELEGPVGRKIDFRPTSSLGDRKFDNYFLRVDSGPDFHWHWSLVVPRGGDRTLGDGQLVFSVIEDEGILCRGTLIGKPLTFDRDQLARWVVTAQRLTLPKDAPDDAVLTLGQLEELAEKLHSSADEGVESE